LIAASDVYEVSAFARQGQWGDRVSLEWTVIALGMTTTGHGPHACCPVQPAGSGRVCRDSLPHAGRGSRVLGCGLALS